ncbi:MAG: 4-(cytidine 5'-diphospho)-2-C-methyl-D-erythritol kinase [Nitrospinae bacterium]|nr:4-(cytidine 5'-diphospho)-2-C-methyl-D-erythritol kinase [Nitrospinota bacterium]MBF0634236.1 4-(cytidine 5'-diphospho)-2-C-methyl-D-erythritol kinase [Nitrospinota bacterium]
MQITARSSAKINLFLKVTGKRPDGYHEICSVMQMVDLFDTLTFDLDPSGKLSIKVSGTDAPADGTNLVIKAAEALRKWGNIKLGARISLEKNIPVSAGLGGGSGNAAVALKTLAILWGIEPTQGEFTRLALSIGADVPFFLDGPCALVAGIGEKTKPVTARKSAAILLVKPDFGVSTAEAYKKSKFDFAPFIANDAMVEDVVSGNPARMRPRMVNDLMPWAMETHPELARLKERVQAANPKPAFVMMSGSGPTLFALYDREEDCGRAAEVLKDSAPFVMATRTLV